jgi:hypothetical protein
MAQHDPHEWLHYSNSCLTCQCSWEEYLDGLRPQCHPVGNWLVLLGRRAKLRWNRGVRVAASLLTI